MQPKYTKDEIINLIDESGGYSGAEWVDVADAFRNMNPSEIARALEDNNNCANDADRIAESIYLHICAADNPPVLTYGESVDLNELMREE